MSNSNCLLCHAQSVHPLCAGCYRDLPWLKVGCPVCALPTEAGDLCSACQIERPLFEKTTAAFLFDYPIKGLIHAMKYQKQAHIGFYLGQVLANQLDVQQIDALLPMPLHRSRLAERGFNQATEIARGLQQKIKLPVLNQVCERIKKTPALAGLNKQARAEATAHLFEAQQTLEGLNVLLVDDVMTTGATLHALAHTVLAAGAKQVRCAVIARTPAPVAPYVVV